jgi:hypothetical protein
MSRGAGGTEGGLGQFLMGFIMMCGGFYLLLNSIHVSSHFGMSMRMYSMPMMGSQFNITSGMILIPFMLGIAIVFYNSKNALGWLLVIGSLSALIFGVLLSLKFSFRHMSAFDLIMILVLTMGGLGLFLRSLKTYD